MKLLSTIIRAVVLSAVVSSPATYASDTPVYSVELPIASYVYHGEDCSLPLDGHEGTDWYPANYMPLTLPVWNIEQVRHLEKNMNQYQLLETLTYFDDMNDKEVDDTLNAMDEYFDNVIDTDDELYFDCMHIVEAID